MNQSEFQKEINKLGISLDEKRLEQLEEYANYLLEYNTHTNLTALKTLEEVYLKHFYDSLTLSKIYEFTNQTLLDVGTGAGFPGLVLAITFPNLKVTLLDSNNKKTTFLKECVQRLHLKNVEIITSRAEDFARNHREEFDVVVSRAVASLRILMELNIPSIKVGGHFLAMKGNAKEEIEEASSAFQKLFSIIEEQLEFDLPSDAGHRTLLKVKKEEITPVKYPREYSKIKKQSL